MACISSDGTLSASGRALLKAVERPATAEEVSAATGLPLFRVRSGLRELAGAGMVSQQGPLFTATGPQPTA
ncbi:MAG: hypothetical protein ACP5VR_09970 [Acidimicrobiales bacterium]